MQTGVAQNILHLNPLLIEYTSIFICLFLFFLIYKIAKKQLSETRHKILYSVIVSAIIIIPTLLVFRALIYYSVGKVNFLEPPIYPVDYHSNDPSYSEKQEPTIINISSLNTENWNSHQYGNVASFLLPNDWYKVSNGDDSVTFGAGIKSYLTIWHVNSEHFFTNRLSTIQNNHSVIKEELVINNKTFTTYNVLPYINRDVIIEGYRDWYLQQGNEVLIFSQSKNVDDAIFAEIISSVTFLR
jgi:hypothetical protein